MLSNLPPVREQQSRDARAQLAETTLHTRLPLVLWTHTPSELEQAASSHRGFHRASDTQEVPGQEQ